MKIGVVFEGGGMRGVYTAGVIEAFLEQGFYPDLVVGVSAGASNGISLVSGQRGRALRTNIDYADEPRYASVRNYLTTGSFFGMDFLFDELPNKLDPFDWDAYRSRGIDYRVGVTDAQTGLPVFFGKDDLDNAYTIIRASCSMPFASPAVEFRGRLYVDGGTVRPIPYEEALSQGCDFLVVVRTQPRDYRKEPQKGLGAMELVSKMPAVVDALAKRHEVYNRQVAEIDALEAAGRAFVIAPSEDAALDRMERDEAALKRAGRIGYLDGLEAVARLHELLGADFPLDPALAN